MSEPDLRLRAAPDILTAKLRRELRALMPAGIAEDLAEKFLNHAAFTAQYCFSWQGKVPRDLRLKQLRQVEQRCHALVLALGHLSDECVSELEAAAVAKMANAPSGGVLPGGVRRIVTTRLAQLLDSAQDLEEIADLAAQRQGRPSKKDRPTRTAAKELAHGVAMAHFEVFGKWPPIGDGWFQSFVRRLGKEVDVLCGVKLVNVVLKGTPIVVMGAASG